MTSRRSSAAPRAESPLASEAVGPLQIGHRYQVIEQLGRGGMAIVYRVRDRSSGAELALKQLAPQKATREPEMRAQFEREFFVLAQLSHPSVIAVYDFGVDVAGAYYTMELLDGGDLTTRAPLDVRAACEIAVQLCSSLSLLHSRKLVHRDISPRNVRCTHDGNAKLIDFGAMVPMGPCIQSVGTPGFVAPEVVHHLLLDERTDLFSLGATLYYALTGRKPFAARTMAELNEAWREQPPPPSQLMPGIPPALDALVLSLLRIDPAGRPRSAFEVLQRLTAISGTQMVEPEQVAQAYLCTPALVGRNAEQRRFRVRLRSALLGQGGVLVYAGEPGVGRSRLLDVCALEAKLAGVTVLRVNGRAAHATPLSGAYAVAEQILEALPELALRCARETQVVESLFAPTEVRLQPLEVLNADRSRAQLDLSNWLRAVCEEQPLVLALDDVERMDDSSLAWIAALAHGVGKLRLLIVATLATPIDTTSRLALNALRTHTEAAGGQAGYLYYAQDTELKRVASLITAPDAALDRFVSGHFRQHVERAAMTTVFTEMDGDETLATVTRKTASGTNYRIALLQGKGIDACVGLVALSGVGEGPLRPEYLLRSAALSVRLVELGDVPGGKP